MEAADYLYIITRGPGCGKTTLISALQDYGFKTVPEGARRIIREQMAREGTGLPWKDRALFADLMLRASLKSYRTAIADDIQSIQFFDRGIPDTICYLLLENISITERLREAANKYRYNKKGFILPP